MPIRTLVLLVLLDPHQQEGGAAATADHTQQGVTAFR